MFEVFGSFHNYFTKLDMQDVTVYLRYIMQNVNKNMNNKQQEHRLTWGRNYPYF
jgi:hypothetical protein